MVRQQKQRTLLSKEDAEMQKIGVGIIPNHLMHICRVKTSHSLSHVLHV